MFFVFLGFALADLGFLVWWLIHGFGVDGNPTLAQTHQVGGLGVCILTCFTHSLTFVYFLGTGLAVKEARANWGISQDYVRHTRDYKLRVYPIAMLSIALIAITGILGGALKSGSVGPRTHWTFASLATAVSGAAFVIALRYILRNGFMLALIRQDIAEIRSGAETGQQPPRLEGDIVPELLKAPEDVVKPPSGFLWGRGLFFFGLSGWLLYAYLAWFFKAEGVSWVPFAVASLVVFPLSFYFKLRHPLPAEVDF